MRRSRFNDPLHGWYHTFDANEAEQLAAEKRAQGLRARLTLKPLTQGIQIYPHRVAWWVARK